MNKTEYLNSENRFLMPGCVLLCSGSLAPSHSPSLIFSLPSLKSFLTPVPKCFSMDGPSTPPEV